MLNEAKIIGRLGQAPEIKQTTAGKKFAILSVASWETWFNKEKQEFEEITEWHRVVCWGDQCDRIARIEKGDLVLVSGTIKTREYTDNMNVRRWTTEIVGTAKAIRAGKKQAAPDPGTPPETDGGKDDDLPF